MRCLQIYERRHNITRAIHLPLSPLRYHYRIRHYTLRRPLISHDATSTLPRHSHTYNIAYAIYACRYADHHKMTPEAPCRHERAFSVTLPLRALRYATLSSVAIDICYARYYLSESARYAHIYAAFDTIFLDIRRYAIRKIYVR